MCMLLLTSPLKKAIKAPRVRATASSKPVQCIQLHLNGFIISYL